MGVQAVPLKFLLHESAGFAFTVPQFPLLGTWGFKQSLKRLQGLNPKGW